MAEVESGRVTTAAGDEKLKEIFNGIRTSKSPAVINYGASWCRVCSQILMNVQKQHSIFDIPPPFISIEMVKELMRCLVLERSDCTIDCGCTLKVV
ncbi:thioredoxin-like 3-3 [Apium graveolens]|uniref:thioredoxin-like 3-3 n=1 Tax=Apium graveolens TaxID=4045 RepID=UPI003D793A38